MFTASCQIARVYFLVDLQALAKYNEGVTPPRWRMIAVTRSTGSATTKYLSSIDNVTCFKAAENNQDEPTKVFQDLQSSLGIGRGDVYGVFSVQGYVDDVAMVRQGGLRTGGWSIWSTSSDVLIDLQVKRSPKQPMSTESNISYTRRRTSARSARSLSTSTSRGWSPTQVSGLLLTSTNSFGLKPREIEPYINELFPGRYTILRPVQFMNLLLPTQPFPFRAGRWVMLRYTYGPKSPNKIHQMISPRDIGRAGAKALEQGPQWMGGMVRLAGWQGPVQEIEKTHEEVSPGRALFPSLTSVQVFGKRIQGVPWPLPLIVKRVIPLMRDFTEVRLHCRDTVLT